MRSTLHLIRTGVLALLTGALTFALVAGGALGATETTRGTYAADVSTSQPLGLSPTAGTSFALPVDPLSFSWDAVPGADAYDVQIAEALSSSCSSASAFSESNVKLSVKVTETGYIPDLMSAESGKDLNDGTYCWRLRVAGDTPGPWSEASSFVISWTARPTGLKFYNAEDGSFPRAATDGDYAAGSQTSRNSGYITWDPVPGATGYDVQLARAISFADDTIMLTSRGFASTAIGLPHMPDDDSYFFRVRAVLRENTRGPWSDKATFQVQRHADSWMSAGATSPTYGATVKDVSVGWNPVPGASIYEVQAASAPSCFWASGAPTNVAPPYWGQEDSINAVNCRLSPAEREKAITINNFMTGRQLYDPLVLKEMRESCPTHLQASCTRDIPDGDDVYWRVRPIWFWKKANETLWSGDDSTGEFWINGSWLLDTSAGYARPNKFTPVRWTGADYDTVTAARCTDPNNPLAGPGCLHLSDGQLAVGNTNFHTSTMQLPTLRWGAAPGRLGQDAPGGFVIQIAHDPFFNDIVVQELPGDGGNGASVGMQEMSYTYPKGLPDDSDGYWWRAIPCQSGDDTSSCLNFYYEGAPGLASLLAGGDDGAVARSFKKSVEVDTKTTPNFGNSPMPLLSIASKGASTVADWERGVQGAEFYEFQLSRTTTFPAKAVKVEDMVTAGDIIRSNTPRIQPALKGDEGHMSLASGTWYWRARPVDHYNNAGGWSDPVSFSVTLAAPTVATANGTAGAGVAVRWSAVNGAKDYELSYGTDPSFNGATTVKTNQLSFRIPSSTVGTIYWRVRGLASAKTIEPGSTSPTDSELIGTWSDTATVSIVPETGLRYGTSTTTVKAGSTLTFEGQLVVAGATQNGQTVQLQRKTTSCAGSGSYVSIAKGRTTGDGRAALRAIVLQNACYRFAYIGDKVIYSAPFAVNAIPVIKLKASKSKKLARGKKTCLKLTSNRVLNGKLTYQYKLKKKGATWTNAGSGTVRTLKSKTLCFLLPKPGKQLVRLSFTELNHPTGGWSQYANTSPGAGTYVVYNVWLKR